MLINTQLVQQYLDETFLPKEIQDALMRAGLEVESSHHLATSLKDVRIGFVREIVPLEGSKENFVCQVDIGKPGLVPIVCGSEHEVREGWGVPVALSGTRLPARKHAIEQTSIRGQPSHGMICLDGELGLLMRSSGLQVFDESTTPGSRLIETIDIDERLLDVSVLPNRPDCLGLIGIARELAAVLGCCVVYPDIDAGTLDDPPRDDAVSVKIEDPARCSRYRCALFDNICVAKSPAWLKNWLLTLGARPINNVVDITNFVMFEWGHPLHAFDFGSVDGARIVVRQAKPGETLHLLDGTDVELNGDDLVIADATRPIALAGIMGGDATQTRPDTTQVLLEAAHFHPTGIRGSRRNHDLSTESSYRFERGTDPNRMLNGAFDRAASLLEQIAGGRRRGRSIDCLAQEIKPRQYRLPTQKVSSYLGRNMTSGQITEALTRIEMKCQSDNGSVHVEVPTCRVDVDDPVVLIEDVARIMGYDAITSQAPAEVRAIGIRSWLDRLRDELAVFLSSQGFVECRTLPLVDPSQDSFVEQVIEPVTLVNPIRQDEATLRRSLLPALIVAVDQNARRTTRCSRFYEIDRTFRMVNDETHEQWVVAGVIGGPVHGASWTNQQNVGFFEAKGIVENVLEIMHVDTPVFSQCQLPGMKAGAAAEIISMDKVIGYLGEVDQQAIQDLHVNEPLFGFQISLEDRGQDAKSRYHSLPRYPAIERDLAIIVDRTIWYRDIEQTIYHTITRIANDTPAHEESNLNLGDLESLHCFDRYEGPGVPSGKLSIGLRLSFRSPTRTLLADAVDNLIGQIMDDLKSEYGAELRR